MSVACTRMLNATLQAHNNLKQEDENKLTIKISELVFPAIAKIEDTSSCRYVKIRCFRQDYFEPRNRSSGTGTEKLTCMTSPMIRRHDFAANGIHDFTCEMRREFGCLLR